MDLRQLRSFVTVAEERQFTRAAERLGFAQSSLSAQIRELERELGMALFHRTTRRVSLTDAGELLLRRARVVLSDVTDMTSEVQRMSDMLAGRVVIGLTQSPGPVDVLELLAGFNHRYPAIGVAVREDLSSRLADELRDDVLDIGILSITEPSERHGLATQLVGEEELVAVVHKDHPLAGRWSITITDLVGERLALSPPGATIRRTVMAAAQNASVELSVGFESREVARLRAIAAAGLGVAILPESDALAPSLPIRALPFAGRDLLHRLSLCWREGRRQSPAARALLREAQATYLQPGGGAPTSWL